VLLRALAIVLTLLLTPFAAETQVGAKLQRIGPALVGVLVLGAAEREHSMAERAVTALREGLRELGWVEGQNLVIEVRNANGQRARLAPLAGELAALPVDVIVALGTAATRAARSATDRLPIVMAGVGDPLGAGFVKSLARPGGTVTGLSLQNVEAAPKRLQLLKEVAPAAARIMVISAPREPGNEAGFREMEAAAARLGVVVRQTVVASVGDLDAVFTWPGGGRTDAVVVQPSPTTEGLRGRIANLALRHRVPTVGAFREYADAGILMSYAANLLAVHRRAAVYVDKLLKGAKPGDLPIEQSLTFELVLNMKTAKALGLKIPQSVLARADEIIE
jgi:putative ABC transport system substrate-binding protein